MDINSPDECQAFNVSDSLRCKEVASAVNSLFCAFHSKQAEVCPNRIAHDAARPDRLDANPPQYLANSGIALSNQTFADITTKDTCQEIHDYLLQKYQLLDRVIQARRLGCTFSLA